MWFEIGKYFLIMKTICGIKGKPHRYCYFWLRKLLSFDEVTGHPNT